jgi:hypothetical protein
MKFSFPIRIAILILSIASCLGGQNSLSKDASAEVKGIPPRATAGDYQFHAQSGTTTVAAEFTGHSLPTLEGPLTTEDYVGIEVALFGPSGAQLKISATDFSLRLNGRKTLLESQPYALIVSSLRDPEWVPPDQPAKSKSSIGTGGQGQGESNTPAVPVKIPVSLQRAMAQRVQRASLPEGDRILPQAGLIYFQYRGKEKNLQSIELVYDGAGGKATLKLAP